MEQHFSLDSDITRGEETIEESRVLINEIAPLGLKRRVDSWSVPVGLVAV